MEIKVGTSFEVKKEVTEALTAAKVGSGLVNVFATPMMIACMEEASSSAIAPFLDEGKTSVGINISTSHCAATPVGMSVRVVSEVTEVSSNGKVISFSVKAFDEKELIGEGTHQRCIVTKERFEEKAKSKLS